MDNYYLFIVGFLGILLVCFVVFYFLKKKGTKEAMDGEQIEQHIQDDHGIKCDGDKCYKLWYNNSAKCEDLSMWYIFLNWSTSSRYSCHS